ncbi:hypothetical protein UFOVP209_47 [uncultured Caudovirales phage]|uniref:Bet_lambda, phage recombination protein Bet n=1 Tax=uncultured Caudovirales phage TaxID=2100421 RepID=A0A6J7WMZ9_9CAUD|nr:hypothetical protein UFOVP209_47 [uncultured Caudovirales phage]
MSADVTIYRSSEVDREQILRYLNLNPRDPGTQALLLVCERYELDPVLKHMVLISGRPYVTRDGYLHIAHASGQFDGLEVVDSGEDNAHWWAKVAVYRKDMRHPFTFIGRYPKADAKHMAKYGPEMAIKTAEVMALRRAFDVGGIAAADEQWDNNTPVAVNIDPATPELLAQISDRISALATVQREALKTWWKSNRLPAMSSGQITATDANKIIGFLDDGVVDAEIIEDPTQGSRSDAGGVVRVDDVELIDSSEVLVNGRSADDQSDAGLQLATPTPQGSRSAGKATITDAQGRALAALVRAVYGEDVDRLEVVGDHVGRDITSFKDLTKTEASSVIDQLKKLEVA